MNRTATSNEATAGVVAETRLFSPGRVEQAALDHRHDRPFQVLLLLLAVTPLPYGANRPWAWLPLALAIFLLGAWVALIPTPVAAHSCDDRPESEGQRDAADRNGERRAEHDRLRQAQQRGNRCWALLWGLWIAYSAMQLLPLAPETLRAIEPGLDRLYAETLLGYAEGTARHSIAVAPAQAKQSLLILGACAVLWWLVGRLCRSRRRLEGLAWTMVGVGVGEAVYALTQPGKILAQGASGTFIDHSHYATFLGMALMVATSLWLGTRHERRGEWHGAEGGRQSSQVVTGAIQVTSMVFLFAGILFSLSRGGVAAAVIGSVVVLGAWAMRRRRGWLRAALVVCLMLVGVLAAGGLTALDALSSRYARAVPEGRDVHARLEVWTQTLKLIESVPTVGVGLGGYEDAFTRYATDSPTFTHLKWDHAHSDLLELAAETGLLGTGLVIGGLALFVGAALYRWACRRDPFATTVGFGCLTALGVALLNSLLNFPFHIPAIAFYAATLAGLTWAVLHHAEPSDASSDARASTTAPGSREWQ